LLDLLDARAGVLIEPRGLTGRVGVDLAAVLRHDLQGERMLLLAGLIDARDLRVLDAGEVGVRGAAAGFDGAVRGGRVAVWPAIAPCAAVTWPSSAAASVACAACRRATSAARRARIDAAVTRLAPRSWAACCWPSASRACAMATLGVVERIAGMLRLAAAGAAAAPRVRGCASAGRGLRIAACGPRAVAGPAAWAPTWAAAAGAREPRGVAGFAGLIGFAGTSPGRRAVVAGAGALPGWLGAGRLAICGLGVQRSSTSSAGLTGLEHRNSGGPPLRHSSAGHTFQSFTSAHKPSLAKAGSLYEAQSTARSPRAS
jgi:hypothetical protein